MKKLFTTLLILFAFTAKAQIGFNVEYAPKEPVLSEEQFMLETSYLTGGVIKWGGLAQTNNSFDFLLLGMKAECLIVKPTDETSLSFLLSWAFDINEVQENEFSDPHQRHYIQAGATYGFSFNDKYTLKLSGSNRYWGDTSDFVFSAGVAIRVFE